MNERRKIGKEKPRKRRKEEGTDSRDTRKLEKISAAERLSGDGERNE